MLQYLTKLRSNEVAALDRKKTIVVLPIAAHEQHGKHLPIGTDTLILEGVIQSFEKNVPAQMDVLVLPTIAVGKSNEHMSFCGTLTYSLDTLIAMLRDMAKSVARHGFEKFVMLNAHGGNTDVLNAVARDMRDDYGLRPFVIDWWFTDFWADLMKDIQQSPRDGVFHACELETSLIMALHPELVDREACIDSYPPEQMRKNRFVTVFGPVNMGWVTADISKTGVIGAATKATPEKGRMMLDYAGKKLVGIFEEIQAIPSL
ncbi:creatininase family protein [Feifania hominis]|uniref:Creatininase family protein n=1 Tax=Feifania hominis TaxID=2763660 RepID=A0A926DCL8_9FIRM|nr:creatininase family protein [Feifania hominis]MBC8536123.1 creatininase family protein [Feifania hominis]